MTLDALDRSFRDTVPALFDARAEDRPHVAAVVTAESVMTYSELKDESIRLARHLAALGVRKGTVVALVAPNGDQWITYWLACVRLGAVMVPMNTFARPEEVERALRHAGAHVLLSVPSFMRQHYRDDLQASLGRSLHAGSEVRSQVLPQLHTVVWLDEVDAAVATCRPVEVALVEALGADVEPADPLTIVYTSGSTGDPKGVIHGHGPTVRQARRLAAMRAGERPPVLWTSMPLNWVGGLTWSFLRVVVDGGTFVTQAVFEPGSALDLIKRTEVDVVTAWGPVLERLMQHPSYDATELAHVAGFELAMRSEDPRPPSALGMTETLGPHSGYSPAVDGAHYPPAAAGSHGRALPGIEHRVIDPATGEDRPDGVAGELLVRGDSLLLGRSRLERDQVFDRDGWYHTGDEVVRLDGWIHLRGRLDDVIKTSGANVSPTEVAAALTEHATVAAAFVTSVPHPVRGADVVAFVVPAGPEGVDLDSLRSHGRSVLATYKVPRHLFELPPHEIPMTPTQKVDYQRLRELAHLGVHTPAAEVEDG